MLPTSAIELLPLFTTNSLVGFLFTLWDCVVIKMEHKRNTVIEFYKAGKSQPTIVEELKHLDVNKMFVYRTIKRYRETGSVKIRHGGGHQKTATTPEMIEKLKAEMEQNPKRSVNQLAKTLNVSCRSIGRILKQEMLTPYRLNRPLLTPAQKKVRMARAKVLKQLHDIGQLDNLVFTGERSFKVYRNIDNLECKSDNVLVWGAVSATGLSPLVFLDHVTEHKKIFNDTLLPWAQQQFAKKHWTLQQNSPNSHQTREKQRFLQENNSSFIKLQQWPPYSPDLNPMDYIIWVILEEKLSAGKYETVDSLKKALSVEWNKIPLIYIRAAFKSFSDRLDFVIRSKGDYVD